MVHLNTLTRAAWDNVCNYSIVFKHGANHIAFAVSSTSFASLGPKTDIANLIQRITHFIAGCLLFVPFVNVIVYRALPHLNIGLKNHGKDNNGPTALNSPIALPAIKDLTPFAQDSEPFKSTAKELQHKIIQYLDLEDLWILTQVTKEKREFFIRYLQFSKKTEFPKIRLASAEIRGLMRDCLYSACGGHISSFCNVWIDEYGSIQALNGPNVSTRYVTKQQDLLQLHCFTIKTHGISWDPMKDNCLCRLENMIKSDENQTVKISKKIAFLKKLIVIRCNQLAKGAWNICAEKVISSCQSGIQQFRDSNNQLTNFAKKGMQQGPDMSFENWVEVMSDAIRYTDEALIAASTSNL